MNMTESKQLAKSALRGTMREHVDMRKHTSWRAGGVAERMYQPADLDDLLVFLRSMPVDEPLYAVGLGSNLLVRDGGLRGTVLLMHSALNHLHLEYDGSVYVEAGVPGAKLARFAASHDLSGAEFFAGIPGTIGGMLAMNAGCYGSETWGKVLRVMTVNRQGEVHVRAAADYEIGYRHVVLRDGSEEWFTAAWLAFARGQGANARNEIKALLSKRIATQPLNQPNAGSVFRNPPGDHAARLIELCGLKGKRMGDAQISDKHANFIVNVGNASAADIEQLINEVQAMVEQRTGVRLQCEVRIIGERKQVTD
jgi:UDP-N-acetylenolpyruvoylglucosamine reductase